MGGIGVVRLSGAGIDEIEKKILDRPAKPGKIARRNFLDSAGEAIDNGLALRFVKPSSYTGEDVLELQGHGGQAVMARLLSRCLELGAKAASPGEFTLRAFENGKIDLAQAEAIADLVSASTEEAARLAAASMRGLLGKRCRQLAKKLTSLRADIEASIDFSDEDIELGKDEAIVARLHETRKQIERLANECRKSLSHGSGATIVLVGAPNAGKSSILNLLGGQDAAIVDEMPGTTRDIVTTTCVLNGIHATIYDTAGLRKGGGNIEREGMRRAKAAMEDADHVVLVHDLSTGSEPARPKGCKASLVVFNKIDLCGKKAEVSSGGVYMSAKTKKGLSLLQDELARLCGMHGETPLFLARQRHVSALENAAAEIRQAIDTGLQMAEITAEHLSCAQRELAAITGEVSHEDLLGEIFSKFCIGK